MPRTAALTILAALVAALAFAGCGPKKEAAHAAENAGAMPASTAAPYKAEAGTPAPAELTGEALLEARCTVCHTLERVQKKKLDAAGWEKTVESMQKKGAELNDAERAALVAYLAATYGK